jgi:hypothetical protein
MCIDMNLEMIGLLQKIDFKSSFGNAQQLVQNCSLQLLGYCDKMESMLHLNMNTSLFFRGMHFETHTLNLFGINTNNLVEFRTARSISDPKL